MLSISIFESELSLCRVHFHTFYFSLQNRSLNGGYFCLIFSNRFCFAIICFVLVFPRSPLYRSNIRISKINVSFEFFFCVVAIFRIVSHFNSFKYDKFFSVNNRICGCCCVFCLFCLCVFWPERLFSTILCLRYEATHNSSVETINYL